MSNPFDQFDGTTATKVANPFDQFEEAPAAPKAPQAVRPSGFMGGMGGAGVGHGGQEMVTSREGREAFVQGVRDTVPMALRIVPPLAATPFGPVASGIAAGAGEAAAQLVEGGSISDPGQVGKSAIVGALPGGTLIRGGTALRTVGRVALEGAKFAGAEAAGEGVKRSVNEGEITAPYGSIKEAASALTIPALMGAGFKGAQDAAGAVVRKGAERQARLQTLAAGGIDQPTLDLVFPSQAPLVNRVAQNNPTVAKLRVESQRPLTEQFEAIAAGAPENEQIYSRLRPYVGKLDTMREEVTTLEAAATSARQRADDLAANAAVSPQEQAALRAEVSAAELTALNAKARLIIESEKNLGGWMDYDSTAQEFRSVVDRLFTTRKEIGAAKFSAAGIPENEAIIPKDALVTAARSGLSRWRGTDMERQILGAIETAGEEGAEALTLAQFRELRTGLSDRFAGADSRQLSAFDAAAKAAYAKMTEASRNVMAKLPEVNLQAYDEAVAYWRETAEAQSSRYARPLLAREASESTFQTLADDIAAGRTAEVRSFNDFVSAIAREAPAVAEAAGQQLVRAVRNSFLGQARTPMGIDTKRLTESLLLASNQFPIDKLGWGSATEVRRWRATMQEFGIKNISAASLDEIFSNPAVQKAAGAGESVAAAARPIIARQAYESSVAKQVLTGIAGMKTAQAANATKAGKLAEAAGLSLQERRQILSHLEADPIARAFTGGQTWGIPKVPGQSTKGLSATVLEMGPQEGLQLIRALRDRNPALADMVQRRVVADTMQFMRPANTPGYAWTLDKSKVRKFFNPAAGSPEEHHAATIKALVGPETYRRYEGLLKAVELVSDVERAGGVMSTDGAKTIFTSSGLARGIGLGAAASYAPGIIAGGLRKVTDLYSAGKYHTLAALASNRPFAEAFWSSGGNIERTLASMGPQRASLLLLRSPELKEEVKPASDAR